MGFASGDDATATFESNCDRCECLRECLWHGRKVARSHSAFGGRAMGMRKVHN